MRYNKKKSPIKYYAIASAFVNARTKGIHSRVSIIQSTSEAFARDVEREAFHTDPELTLLSMDSYRLPEKLQGPNRDDE